MGTSPNPASRARRLFQSEGFDVQIGTDGSIATPDPDLVETLTPEDVGTVIDALRLALSVSVPHWDERRRAALRKFERIRESSDGSEGPEGDQTPAAS